MLVALSVVVVVLALTVCQLPFVWWFVLAGTRTVTIPTDADTIVLTTQAPEILVDIEQDFTDGIEVLMDTPT